MIYAAVNKKVEVRNKSSSGAVFYELAKYIIGHGGIVFAVKLNEKYEAIHGCFDSMDEIDAFLGSKYVQSKLGNTYKLVLKYLREQRRVLFCGTPCQVSGLKSYLCEEYDNLLLVDFVCHGVPSPMVWRSYVNLKKKEPMDSISFRDKTEGWKNFSLKIGAYRKNQFQDTYMQGFIQNIILRPCCYECKFKGIQRQSDITIADLWGVEVVAPALFDDKGTSLVIPQSEKGHKIWDAIKDNFYIESIEDDYVAKYNSNMIESVSVCSNKRERFFNNPTISNLEKLVKPQPIYIKAIRKLIRILKNGGFYIH